MSARRFPQVFRWLFLALALFASVAMPGLARAEAAALPPVAAAAFVVSCSMTLTFM